MTKWDVAQFREHSKLFSLLNEKGQHALVELAHPQTFQHDDVIMTEGESGDTFYVVTEGKLSVRLDSDTGPKEVAQLERGAFVGEIGALVGEPRSATVVAIDVVSCLRFDAEEVQALLNDYPRVREALVKLALKRSEDNLAEMMKD